MNKSVEKNRIKRIGLALLVWLITAVLLIIAAAALIGRMKLRTESIAIAAAGITLISSAAASVTLFLGTKGGKHLMPALLLWVVTASALLMLGFLIDSKGMNGRGLLRVLLCNLIGSMAGVLLPGKQKLGRGKGKFMKAK